MSWQGVWLLTHAINLLYVNQDGGNFAYENIKSIFLYVQKISVLEIALLIINHLGPAD